MSKITQNADGKECIRCGKGAGTVRACHYNGPRQHDYGKGRGIKAHDLMTAEFCDECDVVFTEGSMFDLWENNWDRSEDFLHWIAMTNIRRAKSGLFGKV